MSTHPNVILLLVLTPDGLARKTMRAILEENGVEDRGDMTRDIQIGSADYHHKVMESDYDESWQVSAPEGSLIFFDLVTYGYGEKIDWDTLEKRKIELTEWAKDICQRHHCSFQVYLTANYW